MFAKSEHMKKHALSVNTVSFQVKKIFNEIFHLVFKNVSETESEEEA